MNVNRVKMKLASDPRFRAHAQASLAKEASVVAAGTGAAVGAALVAREEG